MRNRFLRLFLIGEVFLQSVNSFAACRPLRLPAGPAAPGTLAVRRENEAALGALKNKVVYSDVPSVYDVHLAPTPPPRRIAPPEFLSPGLCDPYLEEARQLGIYEDDKALSDARPRALSAEQRQAILSRARRQKSRGAFLHAYLDAAYDFADESSGLPALIPPRWRVQSGDAAIDGAFASTERILPSLVRVAPTRSEGSLLPAPYPFLIAAPARFHEQYYWDTYFGLLGVLKTGRLEVAQMQVENFLEEVRRFGFVPNGTRDYYLSRSQPPFLSSMIRAVYEATPDSLSRREWLRRRAYPLLARDYEKFWMDPATRYDRATGLNHDWDRLNSPRPERHGLDDEKRLGATFRDVRAAAESGLDFTGAFAGVASQVAGVLLNAMLYRTERDLEWAARQLGETAAAERYAAAAVKRQYGMDKFLWNPVRGEYDNYDLREHRAIEVASAASFAPLFVGAASSQQAAVVQRGLLAKLERAGGVMASELIASPHQWDGTNGWAPMQVMAIEGLRRYGFTDDAKRVAKKWVDVIAKVHARTGLLFERYDVEKADYPGADGKKYPTQVGFLWTNSSFVWALTEVLGVKLQALSRAPVTAPAVR